MADIVRQKIKYLNLPPIIISTGQHLVTDVEDDKSQHIMFNTLTVLMPDMFIFCRLCQVAGEVLL